MSKAIAQVQAEERARREEADLERRDDRELAAIYPEWLATGINPNGEQRKQAEAAAQALFDELSDAFGADVAREAYTAVSKRQGQGNKPRERNMRRVRAWADFVDFKRRRDPLSLEEAADEIAALPLGQGIAAATIEKQLGRYLRDREKRLRLSAVSTDEINALD